MAPETFASAGRLVRSHGLKGELSFAPSGDGDVSALVGLEAWIVPPPARGGRSRIRAVRPGPKGPLISLEGFDSIDEARAVTGSELLVHSSELPDDWESEPAADLVGSRVTDELHGDLGEIVEVIETGANDVWVIEGPLGQVLLPVIDDVVVDVDPEAGTASVRLLPGLLPEEGESA